MEASISQVVSALTNAVELIGSAADGPGAIRQKALTTARQEVLRAIQDLRTVQNQLPVPRGRAA